MRKNAIPRTDEEHAVLDDRGGIDLNYKIRQKRADSAKQASLYGAGDGRDGGLVSP